MSTSSIRINPNDTMTSDVSPTTVAAVSDNGFIQPPPLRVRLLCELAGTCLFILFGAGCAANTSDLLTASAAHAIVTVWLVYVLGPVSGGHFNAGATIAFALDGKMKIIESVGYLVAQGIGALIAGGLLLALYDSNSSLGTPALSKGVTVIQGFLIEFICTTVLSFVISFTTTYHTHKEAAFPIGLVVFSSFLIGANRDGAALNPWRWFGPAVASGTFHSAAWIYTVGPVTGFLLGYGLFRAYKIVWNGMDNRPV
jgi:glycerol uptake facilitator-like aquaporin